MSLGGSDLDEAALEVAFTMKPRRPAVRTPVVHSHRASRGDEIKLHRREMTEPAGLWQQKIYQGMQPLHAALVRSLCERLGIDRRDDEVPVVARSRYGRPARSGLETGTIFPDDDLEVSSAA